MQQELEFVNARFNEKMAHRARIAAAHLKISRSEFVRRAVEMLLEKVEAEISSGNK